MHFSHVLNLIKGQLSFNNEVQANISCMNWVILGEPTNITEEEQWTNQQNHNNGRD
jgi:hypothetical protein